MARKNFFRLSPDTDFHNDSIGAAIHAAYGSPAYIPKKWWMLSEGEPLFEIKNIIFDSLREIWEGNSGQILNAGLFSTTYKALLDGVEQGYGHVQYGMPDFEFVRQLQNSAKYFALRKTALQVVQLTALVGDSENGTRRPWSEYKKLAKGVVGNYNQTWLKVEYDASVRSARAARQWKDFEKTKHLFPNITYRKTVSATPDTEHLRYVGITLPMEHPFWDYHTPPLRWNCKCSIKNTDAEPTHIPSDIDITDPVEPAFQNNPGQTGELFNIPLTNYAQQTQFIPDETIEHELRTRILPEMDFNINVFESKTGGKLEIHPAINEKPSEFEKNVRLGIIMANKGHKVTLNPIRHGQKNPDSIIDGQIVEFKEPKRTTKTKSAINNSIKSAKDQAEIVLIHLRSTNLNKKDFNGGMIGSLFDSERKTINSNIKRVIVLFEDGSILDTKREEFFTGEYFKKVDAILSK